MAFDAGAIVGRIRLDTSDWSQGVGRIDKDRKRLGQGFAELGRQMESLGKKMVAVGAAGLGVGALFLRSAMHVQESESLFEVSLGGMADAARKWSNDLADSLQFNRFEIRKSVGMLNVMVKSMGFNEKAAYGMSTSLTQLAYDISSAYDITFEEAFMKLRSGIVGSIEPLLELGILTDENTYKTWAWTNGLVAQGQALSSQQKVLARYGVILDATKTAQGDAVRTAGSATNQWRALNAQAAELGATIGLSLIPDFTAFTQKANEIVKIIKEWVAVNPNLAAGITQTAVALSMVALSSGIVLLTLPTVVKSVVLLSAGIVKLSLAIWTGIPALLAFKIAVFGISAPVWVIVGLIAAIAASIYALSIAWRNNWGGMGDYLSAAVDKIANGILVPFWNWLKKHTERIVELLLSPVKRLMREVAGVSAFVGHLTEDWRDFGGAVESYKKAFAEDPFVKFRENAQKTGEVLIDALHLDEIDFQGFLAELPGTFSDYFQMVKDQVKSDLGAVAGMFSGAWDTV
ncbi:hypothetical protein HQ520_16275, partial [bacterium]|nr:hypothetical protein [bacterium]